MGKSKYTYEFKKQVVNDYLNNEGGYRYITAKYSVSDRKLVRQWVANYKKYGDSGLFRSRKKTVYSFKKKGKNKTLDKSKIDCKSIKPE